MPESPCADCGVDTTPTVPDSTYECGERPVGSWEHYMVLPEVWGEARMKYGDGFLCVGCLEIRLRRRLTREDFDPKLPINGPSYGMNTRRLDERLGYA